MTETHAGSSLQSSQPSSLTARLPDGLLAMRTVRRAVAPMMHEARISAPMTSQLLAGATVSVLAEHGDWLQVRSADDYTGWMHAGYLAPCAGSEPTWRLSLGCAVRDTEGTQRALPLGSRLSPDVVVFEGEAIAADDRARRFLLHPAAIAHSAATLFDGASYLWGGVSPWGCDCSGFVQQIFLLHGITLPRDAWQQALAGVQMATDADAARKPGDLLFFSDRDDRRVSHVGIALDRDRMVHSSLRRGGIAIESLETGAATDAHVARLRTQCVGVRRMVP